jgi:ubiquinone/menaquinone biosynthesis C-methylase UbiE
MVKLDLACGDRKADGFIGVDKYKTPSTDMEMDLLQFPWPWEDSSVDEIRCSHFFEHIPKELRAKFMEECYRIMKEGAIMTVQVPAYNSDRAIMDFTHEWPPVCVSSFLYFNKVWRENNRLTHGVYDIKCDFAVAGMGLMTEEWQQRTYDAQVFASKHYWNSVNDIVVSLTKRV